MSSSGVATLSPARDGPTFGFPYFHGEDGRICNDSILVFVAMSGSMIPLQVLESDSIESVKLRIQTCKGFVAKNQRLVCGGRELARNNSLLRDYGVSDGNVLHLVLRLSDLEVINVRTLCGKEFTFHVHRSKDVGYVKRQVAKKGGELVDFEAHEVLCDGEEVEDQRLIDDISKHDNSVIHLVVRKSVKIWAKPVNKSFELSVVASQERIFRDDDVLDQGFWLEPIKIKRIKLPPEINELVSATYRGLENGYYPVKSSEGTGGTYFMSDPSGNRYVSVFKPIDEEPMAENNPLGLPLSEDGVGLKKGTKVGEGALREVAAYILDHPLGGRHSLDGSKKGFSGVPPTTMIKCRHRGFNHSGELNAKIGSLQMFIENNGSCEEMGPGIFPVNEVHKISVLDMRLANADRHAGNILVCKLGDGKLSLVPIDHGYCLPECFEDCTFDWLYWPQAREPFSEESIEYIEQLDAEEDIALLKFCGWEMSFERARVFRIATTLLKKGARRGLAPFDIGNMMCRESVVKESEIEEMIEEAQYCTLPDCSEATFLECVFEIMDRRLDEIAGKR